jgi:hypothetical protein
MPRGPKGEKRPADVIGAAIVVGRIATGGLRKTVRLRPRRRPHLVVGAEGLGRPV